MQRPQENEREDQWRNEMFYHGGFTYADEVMRQCANVKI
jgi:hypothetical protein